MSHFGGNLLPAAVLAPAVPICLKSLLRNCFGFVDGTVRPISRPDENQRVVYNGHKRVHGLKFQSVVIPNGLIAHLYGPVGELLLCLSHRSSLFFLHLQYKNKYALKKKGLSLSNEMLFGVYIKRGTHPEPAGTLTENQNNKNKKKVIKKQKNNNDNKQFQKEQHGT